jgi:hypothetical protein
MRNEGLENEELGMREEFAAKNGRETVAFSATTCYIYTGNIYEAEQLFKTRNREAAERLVMRNVTRN